MGVRGDHNAPIHVPTTDALGRGIWDPELWQRPLRASASSVSRTFDPCSGSTADCTVTADYDTQAGRDYVFVQSDKGRQWLSGLATSTFAGHGRMSVGYQTDATISSAGMNWMTVQCNYGSQAAQLVCHHGRCGTTRDPLPNSWSASATWDPCAGGAFTYNLEYDTQAGFDRVSVAGRSYSGKAPSPASPSPAPPPSP